LKNDKNSTFAPIINPEPTISDSFKNRNENAECDYFSDRLFMPNEFK